MTKCFDYLECGNPERCGREGKCASHEADIRATTSPLKAAADTPASEPLPVVGYFNSFGNALCKGVPRFSTDISLTPHAPAQAAIDALRADNERLTRESAVLADVAEARKLFDYFPETGRFVWKETRSSNASAGSDVGTPDSDGYRHVRFRGKWPSVHRLCWLHYYSVWPSDLLDHINGNVADNRISNLREADYCQNNQNARRRSSNKSGYKGVYRKRDKWTASIKSRGQIFQLGVFETAELANEAYINAQKKYHGDFALANRPQAAMPTPSTPLEAE